jgi:hypothetical protein
MCFVDALFYFSSPNASLKMVDQGLAWDLDAHVMGVFNIFPAVLRDTYVKQGGYDFLMQNYAANDRICIFGKHLILCRSRFLTEFT